MKAVIVCRPDSYANAVKPKKIEKFLADKGFDVRVLSTSWLSRHGDGRVARKLPGFGYDKLVAYLLEGLTDISRSSQNKRVRQAINSLVGIPLMRRRGALLHKLLVGINPDMVICENNKDIGFLALPRVARWQILDLPVPGAEEDYFGGELSQKGYRNAGDFEAEMYAKADAISFHWHTYSEFVKQTKYDGSNYINFGYGTSLKARKAKYAESPKIIFLGNLRGYWVNTKLLEQLCIIYPNIDVYGGPKPPPGSRINYKGYAPNLDIVADYQFGLITITDDPLRRHSFSSKHLEYMSYGLPVLTPDWRRDELLDKSSIYYNQENFLCKIAEYRDKVAWEKMSRNSLDSARQLTWENALQGLDTFMDNGHE